MPDSPVTKKVQRLRLEITNKSHTRKGDVHHFRVSARPFTGKPVTFEQTILNHELNQQNLDTLNEQFRNSLRYMKHAGGYFDQTANEKDAAKILESLSSTDYGIGIRVKDDMLKKEFIPFAL